MIQLTLTLKMTTAQVIEISVTVNNHSSIQDYVHPDDQTQPTFYIVLLNMLIFLLSTEMRVTYSRRLIVRWAL